MFLVMKFYLVGSFQCISMYQLTRTLRHYFDSPFNTYYGFQYSITRFGQKGIWWLTCQNISLEYINLSKLWLRKIYISEKKSFSEIVHFIQCLFLKKSISEIVHFRKCPFQKLSISEIVLTPLYIPRTIVLVLWYLEV